LPVDVDVDVDVVVVVVDDVDGIGDAVVVSDIELWGAK
jgi:hypothetical protein